VVDVDVKRLQISVSGLYHLDRALEQDGRTGNDEQTRQLVTTSDHPLGATLWPS
jgi:hypothetical protein